MKKTYIKPETEPIMVNTSQLLSGSPGVKSDDYNIKYGGVDEDGDHTPASRRANAWEE